MCGRYTVIDVPSVVGRFGIVFVDGGGVTPRFNIAPSQEIPAVVETDGGRALRWMQWGFQPAWFAAQAKRPPPINARAETLLERPMFRGAVAAQRCIIPADGFFEWKAVPGERRKQPMYIRLKTGGVFGFAGLYAERPDRDSTEPIRSCAIITTSPNELMATIHHRMPVILDRDQEAFWLDPAVRDPVAVMSCLRPYPSEEMEAFAVSSLVSSAGNDQPSLIEPIERG
jgi:putative SOS response-associated peptidase YedK